MRSEHSVDDIMRGRFPQGDLSPTVRSVTERLLSDRSALFIAPDPAERELSWRLAVASGVLPALIVAPSERALDHRAERLARDHDLVACHLRANLTDHALDVLAGQLAGGRWDAAFVSARSLSDPRIARAARMMTPRLLVMEHAHRLSVHSRQYEPAWLHALDCARNTCCVLALSDIASADVCADLIDLLAPRDCRTILSGLDRPGVRIEVRRVPNQPQQDKHLLGLFVDPPPRAIIYANQQVEAERLAALIEDERGFDSVDLTNLNNEEFGATLRRFREGGVRVLVTTGALEPGPGWPEIPVIASVGLPDSLELLHRQMQTAHGDQACFTLIHRDEDDDEEDEGEYERWPQLERAALQVGPDAGHLLAIHAAAVSEERLSSFEISRRTGLHPDDIAIGLSALIRDGVVRPLARGDDWIRARASQPLSTPILERWARHVAQIRKARRAQAREIPKFVKARGCRRKRLAEAFGYPLSDGECRCDRCRPKAPVRIPIRIPGGYPIKTGNFRGWALALYRRPGDDEPTEGPGMLVEKLKYEHEEGCGRRLAWLMHRRVRESRTYRDCDVIVAVPPSSGDQAEAPAALLGREIGRLSDIPVAEVLNQAKERRPQKELTSDSAKRRNISGAFEVVSAELIDGQIVLLVDDIYDSGATMHEAATALVRAGARDVRMLTAVRTAFGWRRST
ncbi:MAG: phosphoribosyltransferase family protein [Armatimonadota bacterium]